MAGTVVGRDTELAAIEGTLGVVAPELSTLVIEGEAGIGKTTVWREAIARGAAHGYRILECRAAEAEARLSYAALADLLAPVEEEHLAALPAPQRRALDVALLRADADGPAPSVRAIAAAVSSLVAGVAAEGPVLLAIDDVQWLDPPTAQALQFALRRLGDRPVVLVATRRLGEGGEPAVLAALPGRVARHRLGPLSLGALHAIVREQLGHPVPRPLLGRIERASQGNPFYALEIVRAVAAGGGIARYRSLPVPDDLRQLLAARLRRLPPQTRDALLVASALTSPTTTLVAVEDLEPAEEDGIVRVEGGHVTFTHPLFAAAVYGMAPARRRRDLHARLATSVDDAEERARHLGLSATQPDEAVAALVEAGARAARARGSPESAGELAQLAAALTPPGDRAAVCRRTTDAASHFFHAGDRERARALLEPLLAGTPRGRARGEALKLLAEIRYHQNSYADAMQLLQEALGEDDELEFVVRVSLALGYASAMGDDVESALGRARVALDHAERLGEPGLLAEALAFAGVSEGYVVPGTGWDKLRRAVELEDRSRPLPIQLRPSVIAAELSGYEGRLAEGTSRLLELREWFIERGEDSDLPYLLVHICWQATQRGDFDAALDAANEAVEIAEQAGSDTMEGMALAARAKVYACRGDAAAADADLAEAAALVHPTGWALGLWLLAVAEGFVRLSTGDLDAAGRAFAPPLAVLEQTQLLWPPVAFLLADAAETLVGLGDGDRAERVLTPFEQRFASHRVAWVLMGVGRCRSLALAARGDLEAALAAADAALADEANVEVPLEVARTLLAKGHAERRLRRRRAARATLERALAICEEIRAPLWAAKVEAELSRLGPRAEPGELTATEERVARLAADGLTNAEIAASLSLSRRTVESNLARSYRKLGIRSRAQLATALAARTTG